VVVEDDVDAGGVGQAEHRVQPRHKARVERVLVARLRALGCEYQHMAI